MSTSVSVFGLGYVGWASSACFASEGHRVIGVELSQAKVDQFNAGRSTIVEEGIADMVADVVKAGRLSATTDVREAVLGSEI
jgi:GDP-mannose 6-dehydrogenase